MPARMTRSKMVSRSSLRVTKNFFSTMSNDTLLVSSRIMFHQALPVRFLSTSICALNFFMLFHRKR